MHELVQPEVFDPVTRRWELSGGNHLKFGSQTATLLPDGRVLIAGGNVADPTAAYLYDYRRDQWHQTGSMLARSAHSAVLVGRTLLRPEVAANEILSAARQAPL